MKLLLVLFFSSFLLAESYACKCTHGPISEHVAESDQIFVGTAVKKFARERMYYLFSVSNTFKGTLKDTVTIQTGFGGGDCGFEFKTGEIYLVYANEYRTSRCHRTRPAQANPDIVKLNYLFRKDFAESIGKSAKPLMTTNEAAYFNAVFLQLSTILFRTPTDFNFNNKRIAFFFNRSLISKQQYFQELGGKDVIENRIILTEKESKKANGHDALIVVWEKQTSPKNFRKWNKLHKRYEGKRFRKKVLAQLMAIE